MGQYHKLVNLDKQEWVDPHGLGLGSKQYEQTGCEASLADAIYLLVMTSPNRGGGDWKQTDVSGRWAGDRVVVVGDYTDDSDLPQYPNAKAIYGQAVEGSLEWHDLTFQVREAFTTVFDVKYYEKKYPTFTSWQRDVLVN